MNETNPNPNPNPSPNEPHKAPEPGFSNVKPGSPAAPADSPELQRDRARRDQERRDQESGTPAPGAPVNP